MLIPIPILIDLCPHLVASMTAVHENLSGGLQTLKYCIYVYFDNRPVYEAPLLSLWKHTTVCKISLCISCWIKNSWVLSPESITRQWICELPSTSAIVTDTAIAWNIGMYYNTEVETNWLTIADNISNVFSWQKNHFILIEISLNFVPLGPIDNKISFA